MEYFSEVEKTGWIATGPKRKAARQGNHVSTIIRKREHFRNPKKAEMLQDVRQSERLPGAPLKFAAVVAEHLQLVIVER